MKYYAKKSVRLGRLSTITPPLVYVSDKSVFFNSVELTKIFRILKLLYKCL